MTTMIKNATSNNESQRNKGVKDCKDKEVSILDFNARKKSLDLDNARKRIITAGELFEW